MLTYIKLAIAGGVISVLLAFGAYWLYSQKEISNLNQSLATSKAALDTDNITINELNGDIASIQDLLNKYSATTSKVHSAAKKNNLEIETQVPLQTTPNYVNNKINQIFVCSELETGATADSLGFSNTVYQNWVLKCAN
jgi:hypothetical protein